MANCRYIWKELKATPALWRISSRFWDFTAQPHTAADRSCFQGSSIILKRRGQARKAVGSKLDPQSLLALGDPQLCIAAPH